MLSFGFEVSNELARARNKHPKAFNSAHEGFAILLEEVDELWDEVRAQSDERRYMAMRKELIQIAAMCCRFIEDVCEPRMPEGPRLTEAQLAVMAGACPKRVE